MEEIHPEVVRLNSIYDLEGREAFLNEMKKFGVIKIGCKYHPGIQYVFTRYIDEIYFIHIFSTSLYPCMQHVFTRYIDEIYSIYIFFIYIFSATSYHIVVYSMCLHGI